MQLKWLFLSRWPLRGLYAEAEIQSTFKKKSYFFFSNTNWPAVGVLGENEYSKYLGNCL